MEKRYFLRSERSMQRRHFSFSRDSLNLKNARPSSQWEFRLSYRNRTNRMTSCPSRETYWIANHPHPISLLRGVHRNNNRQRTSNGERPEDLHGGTIRAGVPRRYRSFPRLRRGQDDLRFFGHQLKAHVILRDPFDSTLQIPRVAQDDRRIRREGNVLSFRGAFPRDEKSYAGSC